MAADSSGTITVALPTGSLGAFLNAIQVVPVVPGAVILDAGGTVAGAFASDADYSQSNGGSGSYPSVPSVGTSGVNNAAPQEVYLSERYGAFTYTIPGLAPGGSYTIRLDFAENFATGSGQRHTTVSVNGYQVLTNFDTYAAAGGAHRAAAEMFQGTANALGNIVIVFSSDLGGAQVNGIEVYPTAPGTYAGDPAVGNKVVVNPAVKREGQGNGRSAVDASDSSPTTHPIKSISSDLQAEGLISSGPSTTESKSSSKVSSAFDIVGCVLTPPLPAQSPGITPPIGGSLRAPTGVPSTILRALVASMDRPSLWQFWS